MLAAGEYGIAVEALELGDGRGGVVVLGCLGAQVVLAVEVDARAVAVGADGDGGPPVVGVGVDDQAAVTDGVVDLLGVA
ncbi:hypothetical protein [Streptomyces sp. CB02959]|uniref:hypothetical protein n=1 Tax=Streptomyces sp. CB02959 TaxID=2020330 RepID=UPI0015E14BED|nr:hypothetical protein [Streptomyces sp. CB02959]